MSRPAPDVPPPSYATLPLRYYRSSLRPVVLLITAFGAIWSLAVGVEWIKDRRDNNDTAKLKTIYLVLAIMYFVTSAIEIYGFAAAYLQRIRLVLWYFYASAVAAIIVTASEVLRLVVHFVMKNDIINSCAADQLSDNTPGDTISLSDAQSLCHSSWNNGNWWDVGLLILTAILSFLFASIAASYAHQLQNPSTLRTQQAQLAPSSAYAYPLASYPYPPPAGPPPPGGFGGGGYYPQREQQYAAPPYAPPPNSGGLPGYDGDQHHWEGEKKEQPTTRSEDPFADTFATNRNEESTDTVTLEPRRENEGRV